MNVLNYLKIFFKKDTSKQNTPFLHLEKIEELNNEIFNKIEKIDWSTFDTAYGNAQNTIPKYLKELYSINDKESLNASHELWSSLCHQHAYISSASIPAYDFLKDRLINANENLQIELLDIFYGFTLCSLKEEYRHCEIDFINEMKQKLLNDKTVFNKFTESKNKEIKYFADLIIKEIDRNKTSNR